MAVAGEDAGVTLVSYIPCRSVSNKPPVSPKSEKCSKDGKWKVKWPDRNRSSSLSRLLSGCLHENCEDSHSSNPLEEKEEECVHSPAIKTVSDPSDPPSQVKLIGYKRSHSYCGRDLSPPVKSYDSWHYPSVDRRRMERSRREKGVVDPLLPVGTNSIDHSDTFNNFVKQSHDRFKQSQDRFNQILEEKGFTPIPPPAGFGNPTRPCSLMTGSASLEDAICQKRNTFSSQRAIKSDGSPPNSEEQKAIKAAFNNHTDASSNGNNRGELDDRWCDLPTSPISPPSPFQHPFFRRQLGLTSVPQNPWARFSGFGVPRLTPMIIRDTQNGGPLNYPDSHLTSVTRRLERGRSKKGRKGQYEVSTTRSMVRYCSDGSDYK